jgi:hypothetical protein
MRTPDQIDQIKKYVTDPYAVTEFLTLHEIDYLVSIFENHIDEESDPKETRKVFKPTGGVQLSLLKYMKDPIVSDIIDRIKKEIGEVEISTGFFFLADYPHILHNDDFFNLPNNVYKGITLPLRLDNKLPDTLLIDYPELCFFNQFYFHGPAKFVKNNEPLVTWYNEQLYEYKNIDGLDGNVPFDREVYKKYLTHLKLEWLEGMSFHSALTWKPGNALVFDSVRLHCASDFRKLGYKSKLGISIFTKKK